MFERWVLQDVELHGVQIPRGAELGLLFASANRDPRRPGGSPGSCLAASPSSASALESCSGPDGSRGAITLDAPTAHRQGRGAHGSSPDILMLGGYASMYANDGATR